MIAACLCLAFEQLSEAGEQILKAEQGQVAEPVAAAENGSEPAVATAAAPSQSPFQYNKRAARRNELHHSNLAGKGGLLLDFASVETKSAKSVASAASAATSSTNNSPTNGNGDACSTKPVATWDLEDCRKWLTEVPRQIAQNWVDAREKSPKGIPAGSLEDLEGELVMHTFTLIEHLEQEMHAKQESNGRKVVTPRLNDLAKLGINWQHKHERGAGSKSLPQTQKSKRTAGQILIMKTAKKLGSILDDPIAGEAIHKKLREVVDKQDTMKKQKFREEASRQRLMQMKRKPWLQARLQS